MQLQQFNPIGTSRKFINSSTFHFDINHTNADLFFKKNIITYPEFSHIVLAMMPFSASECETLKGASYRANVTNLKLLIDSAAFRGLSTIFLSSDYVFSGSKGNYNEFDEVNPVTNYGVQKLVIEQWLTDNYPDSLILRLGKVVGGASSSNSLLSSWYRDIVSGNEIKLATDQYLGPVHVNDVTKSIGSLLLKQKKGHYHISNGEIISRYDFFEELQTALERFGLPFKANKFPCKLKDVFPDEQKPLNTALCNKKIINELGLHFFSSKEICDDFARNERGRLK